MMFLKDVCTKTGTFFFLIFCGSKRMVAMVNDDIIYTFNSKCQKSSECQASFFILKVSIMILVFFILNVTKNKRAKGKHHIAHQTVLIVDLIALPIKSNIYRNNKKNMVDILCYIYTILYNYIQQ